MVEKSSADCGRVDSALGGTPPLGVLREQRREEPPEEEGREKEKTTRRKELKTTDVDHQLCCRQTNRRNTMET